MIVHLAPDDGRQQTKMLERGSRKVSLGRRKTASYYNELCFIGFADLNTCESLLSYLSEVDG